MILKSVIDGLIPDELSKHNSYTKLY